MLALTLLLATIDPVPPGITSTFPDESVVLPTNARPVAFTSAPEGAVVDILSGANVLDVDTVGSALVVNPGALPPGGTLSISSRCEGCQGGRVFTWTVGDDDDITGPTFAEGGATNEFILVFGNADPFTGPAGYEVDVDLPLLDELALVRLDGTAGSFFADSGGNEATHLHFFIQGGDERTECFEAAAVDVAGNETLFAEPLCFELTHDLVEEGSTCATGGGVAPLAFASLVLLVRVRRLR